MKLDLLLDFLNPLVNLLLDLLPDLLPDLPENEQFSLLRRWLVFVRFD